MIRRPFLLIFAAFIALGALMLWQAIQRPAVPIDPAAMARRCGEGDRFPCYDP